MEGKTDGRGKYYTEPLNIVLPDDIRTKMWFLFNTDGFRQGNRGETFLTI